MRKCHRKLINLRPKINKFRSGHSLMTCEKNKKRTPDVTAHTGQKRQRSNPDFRQDCSRKWNEDEQRRDGVGNVSH